MHAFQFSCGEHKQKTNVFLPRKIVPLSGNSAQTTTLFGRRKFIGDESIVCTRPSMALTRSCIFLLSSGGYSERKEARAETLGDNDRPLSIFFLFLSRERREDGTEGDRCNHANKHWVNNDHFHLGWHGNKCNFSPFSLSRTIDV